MSQFVKLEAELYIFISQRQFLDELTTWLETKTWYGGGVIENVLSITVHSSKHAADGEKSTGNRINWRFKDGKTFHHDNHWGKYVLRNPFGILLNSWDAEYVDSLSDVELVKLRLKCATDKR